MSDTVNRYHGKRVENADYAGTHAEWKPDCHLCVIFIVGFLVNFTWAES